MCMMHMHEPLLSAVRKPVNISLDPDLLIFARAHKVNISRAAEEGLRAAISRATRLSWQTENAEALASSNAYAATHDLSIDAKRPF